VLDRFEFCGVKLRLERDDGLDLSSLPHCLRIDLLYGLSTRLCISSDQNVETRDDNLGLECKE
jgi:hypothetical protein